MAGSQKIGKYLLLEEQEKTSVGSAWRAADIVNGRLEKHYLVDFVDDRLVKNDAFLDHYLNQSLLVSKLEHPNILRKITSIHEGGKLAAVFEYQEGFSLEKVLERCRSDGFPLSIDHALLVASKLLAALSYAKTKHVTHGFVNPSIIFVTHEGEIKLRGFALSSALRQYSGGDAVTSPFFKNYVPPGVSPTAEDRDQLDIFGVGCILYEMLTGDAFNESGSGDPTARIANATTAAEGEAIPTQIANILIAALDPNAPSAYSSVSKMAKDMEDLLYSGEYSPTTFNLAFFMHSAFRVEMEELGEKLSKEAEQDFSSAAVGAAPVAATPATPPPRPAAGETPKPPVVMPESHESSVTGVSVGQEKKSKTPILLIGGVLAAVAVVALAFIFMGGGNDRQAKLEERKEALKAEGERQKAEAEQQREQDIKQELELLRSQLAQQHEEEKKRKSEQLEADILAEDQQLAQLKAEAEAQKDQKEIQDRLAKLDAKRKELEELERVQEERQKELESQAVELLQLQKQLSAEEKAEAEAQQKQASTDEPKPAKTDAVAQTAEKTDTTTSADSKPSDNAVATSTVDAVDSRENEPVDNQPLVEGMLVSFDDKDLIRPAPLDRIKPLDVPRKALRAGVVKRRETLSFLLKILVDENGKVEEATIFRNPLKGKDDYGMLEKAIEHAKDLRFTSPVKQGVKVKVWTFIPIHFQNT